MENFTEVKTCQRCAVENPHYTLKDGKTHSWCIPCVNAYNKAQYRKHKPTHQARMARANRRRKYGLSPEQFDAMFDAQAGKCKVCAVILYAPVVDHDHKTGIVRGLLCCKCNTGLGMFLDDTTLLEAAIGYLRG